jgi:hypothetical protein
MRKFVRYPERQRRKLYDEFALDSARRQSQTLQYPFIPISICALQVFQELSPLMNKPTQIPPIRHVALKVSKMTPQLAYLQRE